MGSSRPGLKYNGVSNAWEMTGKGGTLIARFGDSGDLLFPRRGAFKIAKSSSTVGSGIEVGDNRTVAFGIYADDGGIGTSGITVSGITCRLLTNVATAATSREYFGIWGKHVSAAGTTFEHNDAAILGSKEITTTAGSFGGTSGDGVHAAIYARVAVTVTSTDVEDSGMLVGFASMSLITSGYVTVAAGGILAAYFAGKHTGMQSWDYGLYIFSGTCLTGIGIGDATLPATTVTTGMSAIRVYSDFTGLTTTSHLANYFISKYTVDGTGSLRTVVGQVDLSGTQTTQTTAQYLVGVHGRAKVSGTAYNSSLFVSGVMGQILDGGTWTAADHVSAIWADWQLNNAMSGIASTELLYLSNNANDATNNPTNVVYIYAPRMTNMFNFNVHATTAGSIVAASTTAGTMSYTVRCVVNGTTAYLHLFDA